MLTGVQYFTSSHNRVFAMAMRPEVLRRGLVIIVTAIAQWFFVRLYLLESPDMDFTKNQRVLIFCASSLAGGFVLFSTIVYMFVFGRDRSQDPD